MRNKLRNLFLILISVYLTGYFVAGNQAGYACNTFPKIGEDWILKSKHLNKEIPLWKNLTENKLVVQVIHRTLAWGVVVLYGYNLYKLLKLNLSARAKFSLYLLTLVLGTQVGIGIKVIHKSVPLELGSLHQIGAVTVLTAFLFALHSCRMVDVRHIKNLFGKLKIEDPKLYRQMLNHYKVDSDPAAFMKQINKYRR